MEHLVLPKLEAENCAEVNSFAPILWLTTRTDEVRFCACVVNAGKPDDALGLLKSSDFADERAAKIFQAAHAAAINGDGTGLIPEKVAAQCLQRANAADDDDDREAWEEVAAIVLGELTTLPKGVQSPSDEALKVAQKIKAQRPKRAKRDEPTPDEIAATAQAVQLEAASAAVFPDLSADKIPAPALLTGEKPEYDPHQLRALLYPSWACVSLETEKAHAERAAQHVGDTLLFCPELGFLHFEPSRGQWRSDDKDASLTTAKLAALAPAVRAEAATLLRFAATLAAASRDADARAMSRAANSLLNHAKHIEKRSFLAGAATFLAADLRAEVAQFAPAPWAFAFANGRAFCRGAVRNTKRDDFFFHVSPVAFELVADRSEWHALLSRITAGDADFARTLQDAAAYAVSGASSLRSLLWCYGPKGTGKSTFCELLQTLLGESSATVDTALLQDNSSRERLGAALWGKRAAFVAEAGNKRIDAELLKTLSGGDRLSVRFLYREAFTASPSHCLILAANDAPKTDAYDDALKDRVIALPFTHALSDGSRLSFVGHKRLESARRDPNSDLLKGFAAWVCEGLERLYRTQEIYRAPAVVAATAQFWADTDPLTPFWETVAENELKAGIAKSELRGRYEAWCQTEGQRPCNRNQWTRACENGRNLQTELRGTSQKRVHFWVI